MWLGATVVYFHNGGRIHLGQCFCALCGAEKISSVLQSQPNELVTRNYWQEEDSPEAVGQYASS